jgi:hypothetical protein
MKQILEEWCGQPKAQGLKRKDSSDATSPP